MGGDMYGGLFGDLPSTNNSKSVKDDKKKEPARGANKPVLQKKKELSSVSGLGSTGTSMAFVPHALRQRRRPASATKVAPNKIPPSNISTNEKSAPVTKTRSEATSLTSVLTGEEKDAASPAVMEEESDERRLLHESVTDPYDPLVPNDLLAYWERKKHERQRIEMEREARESLERQTKLRQQLELERREIESTGDVNQIVQHRVERSMGASGRGRGVTNLPAWLVKQQKDNLGDQNGHDGRTVLLSNLTAPGEVDEDLAAEVQEECEETCGKVESVRVHDAQSSNQPEVRVYVTFANPQHAEKAASTFNGRMFGNRRITAKLSML